MKSRWLRLKLRAMNSRHYWRLRSQRQEVTSRIAAARLATDSRAADLSSLTRTTGGSLVKSLILMGPPLLALLLTQWVGSIRERWPRRVSTLPNWCQNLLDWLAAPVPETFDPSALPSAAISVAGVFVAVYFATVTFVVSTSYRDATRKLRNQIIRQPETRWYASFFTQAVVYVALTLSLPLLNQSATPLTLIVAGLAAALVVLSFGRIWITLFVLLEPTALFPQIQRDLSRWVRRAYKLGIQERPSETAVRRANARIRESLEILKDLVTLILDREHERVGNRGIDASFDPRIADSVGTLLVVWENYSRYKHAIRHLPGWNPTRTQSKDWFLSSDAEVGVALATGTTLAGSDVVDDLWFERWIADFLERLLAGRDLRSTASALYRIPQMSRVLSARGQFEELRLWQAATTFGAVTVVSEYARERGQIATQVPGANATGGQLSREQHLAMPGEASAHNLVDHVLLESINACLGYRDYSERMRHLLPRIGVVVVDKSEQVIAGKLVTQIVRNLREAISIELRVEGQRVTPDNALGQLVARGLATEIIDEIDFLLKYFENELWPWAIEVGSSKSWAAGASLSRATELTAKLGAALRQARQLLDKCESMHIDKDDRWPETDASVLLERARTLGERLEMPVARLAATVDSAPDSDRPDHFGWAYYRAHENILQRLLDRDPGDSSELRNKVALLYIAGEIATQRLQATVRRNDPSVINSYVAEPFLRFLQLSGIALVLSEVVADPNLFSSFQSLWSGLLSEPDRSNQVLSRAAATLSVESGLFAITPGGVERTNIQIRANQALEECGVPRGLFDYPGFGAGSEESSPSLSSEAHRLLRDVRYSNFEGAFYARWLRPQALAAGATEPKEIEQYLRLLDLEDEHEDEGDDDA